LTSEDLDLLGGRLVGVFQLERPMRALMRSLAPTTFDDVAASSRCTGGPDGANMHNDYGRPEDGRKPVKYARRAEEVSRHVRAHDLPRVADAGGAEVRRLTRWPKQTTRKACGKKIRDLMAKEREKFVSASTPRATDATGNEWFDIMERSRLRVPKAHAYGTDHRVPDGVLKAHHRSSNRRLLTSGRTQGPLGRLPERVAVEEDHRRRADVNGRRRTSRSTARDPLRLSAVRNVGEGWWPHHRGARGNGPFTDFHDSATACPHGPQQARHRSLVKAAAFDSLGHPRKGLLVVHELVIERPCASGSCATRPR